MPRYFKRITIDELKEKLIPILEDEDFPYNLGSHPIISKDLDKVQFDFENWETERSFVGYPCGYEMLSNGLAVLFVNAGGDWEYPIVFILYFDGKKIRAYIPKEGNSWNRKTKSAYGNDDTDSDDAPAPNPDLIRKDIIDRITEK